MDKQLSPTRGLSWYPGFTPIPPHQPLPLPEQSTIRFIELCQYASVNLSLYMLSEISNALRISLMMFSILTASANLHLTSPTFKLKSTKMKTQKTCTNVTLKRSTHSAESAFKLALER